VSWQTTRLVEFNHVDGANIVFYPRYFEMINSVIEEYFADFVGYAFAPMHIEDRRGVPTGRIAVDFLAPSRLGETLEFTLKVTHVGNASLKLEIDCAAGGRVRFRARQTLIRMDLDSGKSDPWPDRVRARLTAT
jgi:4-hydroxybenzoyl-CoA thioesterase